MGIGKNAIRLAGGEIRAVDFRSVLEAKLEVLLFFLGLTKRVGVGADFAGFWGVEGLNIREPLLAIAAVATTWFAYVYLRRAR